MFEFEWLMPRFEMDGAIGAASSDGAGSAEPLSVAAGAEAPVVGSAPAAAPVDGGTVPDVSQQESFATRLREATGKIEERYKPIQGHYSNLEKVAKLAGFEDPGEYLSALEAHAKQQHDAAEAQRLQVDPETYRQYFAPLKEDLNQSKQQLAQLQQSELQRTVKAEFDRLRSAHPDFESVQDKVLDLASERGYPLEEAYKLIVFDERVNAAKQAGQQEAIQKLQANAAASPGAVGGDAPDQSFDFTKLSKDERQKYYERAKRGELKSLR